MDIVQAVLGMVLLLTGRKLYWLFVGVVGFAVGIGLAQAYLQGENDIVLVVIALVAGFIGVLLALFLQRLAVGAAGFLAGGYAAVRIVEMLRLELGSAEWVVYLVAGLVSAALVAALFDWALILLSSLTGASMMTSIELIHLNEWVRVFILVLLFVIGFSIQSAGMRDERRRRQRIS